MAKKAPAPLFVPGVERNKACALGVPRKALSGLRGKALPGSPHPTDCEIVLVRAAAIGDRRTGNNAVAKSQNPQRA